MRTYSPRAIEVVRTWRVVDASGRPLGRLASEVAQLLRGKHKPGFVPHMDVGDYVVVINAARVAVSGKSKPVQKKYYRHSGYLGSLRAVILQDMLSQRPERAIEHAVRGMLPKTSLGRAQFRKLRVYGGPKHPHGGQVGSPVE